MITKNLKWIGMVIGALIFIPILLAFALNALGKDRLTKTYDVKPETVSIPTDAVSIESGKHWAAALCAHCHGEDFSGKPLLNDATIGFVPAPNLTAGKGGAGGSFTDGDWVRAIRHGVDPEGRALIGMPSMNYYYMNDVDLGALIAYLKTVPPVDHHTGEPYMSFIGKVLVEAGAFGPDILPAESIQHTTARPSAPVPGVTVDYGAYLVRLGGCRDCHGHDLKGGHSPEPGSPQAPDLTPNGTFGPWSKEAFLTAVRTMNGKGMPWDQLKPLSDPELEAIYLYLQSMPAK